MPKSLPFQLPVLRKREQKSEKTSQYLAQAIADLEAAYSPPKKPNDNAENHFISQPALRKILDRDRLRKLLQHCKWYKEDLLDLIYKEFLRIIGILIVIKWPDWEDFKKVFLDPKDAFGRPSRRDTRLPFLEVDFIENNTSTRLFKWDQYIFCPIVIEEDSHILIGNEKRRLPFLSSTPQGDGGSGTVFKVEVERFQIRYRAGEASGEYNHRRKFMARKLLESAGRGSKSFQTERRNLELFKDGVANCKVIQLSFASFVHGGTLNIIYPLADLDLHTFLYGKYDKFSPHAANIKSFHVFEQAQRLASALNFLHTELYINGRPYECAHLDLKPENVLIFWLNNRAQGSNPGVQNPAGFWKLSDFGVSVVRSRESGSGHENAVGDQLLVPADIERERSSMGSTRVPGPWQPPELEQGRVTKDSDMWSFGCVLATVLAFAIGGPAKVRELYGRRQSPDLYDNDYFYTKIDDNVVVKPEVMSWLEEEEKAASSKVQETWIHMTRTLITKLLKIERRDRASAKTARTSLQEIMANTKNEIGLSESDIFEGIGVRERQLSVGSGSDDSLPMDASQELRPSTPADAPPSVNGTRNRRPEQQADPRKAHGPPSHRPERSSSTAVDEMARPLRPAAPDNGQEQIFEPSGLRTREPSFSWPTDSGEVTFARLEAPSYTIQTKITSDGLLAAFLSRDRVIVYLLSSLVDLQQPWSTSMSSTKRVLMGLNKSACKEFMVSSGNQWTTVLLAGTFVAMCSAPTTGHDDGIVQVHDIDMTSSSFGSAAMKTRQMNVPETCWDTKLSSRGALLLLSPDHLDLHFPDESHCQVPLSSSSELQTATFSENGEWLCAWYTTARWQWWCIWNMNTSPPTRTSLQKTSIPPAPTRSNNFHKILLPFSSKPWFGACDQYGNGHLIRERRGSHQPKDPETFEELCDGVIAGVALPDDKGMLIVRRPDSTSKPKVAIARVSSEPGNTRVQVRPWTQVERSFDGDKCGLCVAKSRDAVVFFTCHLDGFLIRKIVAT